MSNVRFKNINGVEYSWANIIFTMLGRNPVGVRSISYSKSAPKTAVMGTGQEPVGYGYNNIEYTASISLLQSEVQKLKNIAPNGDITDLTPFDILITYNPEPTKLTTDILQNVQFNNLGVDVSQGDGEVVVELELFLTGIEFGVSPA